MNPVRATVRTKGQFKCFRCRLVTKSKDGAWHEQVNQQVFICKTCERNPAFQVQPSRAGFRSF